MLIIKIILKNHMKRPLREFLDTLDTPLVLACGIPKVLTSSSLAIPIRILPGVKLTERAQQGDVNYLGDLWYLGVLRNKFMLLSTAEVEYIAAGACCA